jgi:hypothetical protein
MQNKKKKETKTKMAGYFNHLKKAENFSPELV